MMNTSCTTMDSPFGILQLLVRDGALIAIRTIDERAGSTGDDHLEHGSRDGDALAEAQRQLQEYFQGARRSFSLELAPQGTTFQRQVWKLLEQIPYGTTTTYGQIASRLGRPTATRAVGMANARNPIPFIVPCHRVIGRNGTLTGYAGGLEMKRALLELEQVEKSPMLAACSASVPDVAASSSPSRSPRRGRRRSTGTSASTGS